MASEVERALHNLLVAEMEGAILSYRAVEEAKHALNSLKSGEVVVVDAERVKELAHLLACALSTLGMYRGQKQAARIYNRLMDTIAPVITNENLRAYLRGDDGEDDICWPVDPETKEALRREEAEDE